MKNYIIFDLEATCIRDKKSNPDFENEIIEIGAVKLNSKGDIIDKFSVITKPRTDTILTEFCTELTTITQNDIDNGIDLKIALIDFYNWSKDSKLISWGGYDMTQITRDTVRKDLLNEIDLNDMIDRHLNFRVWYKEFKGMKKRCGMRKALNIEKIEMSGTHHRGIDDAINISKIFTKYVKEFTL